MRHAISDGDIALTDGVAHSSNCSPAFVTYASCWRTCYLICLTSVVTEWCLLIYRTVKLNWFPAPTCSSLVCSTPTVIKSQLSKAQTWYGSWWGRCSRLMRFYPAARARERDGLGQASASGLTSKKSLLLKVYLALLVWSDIQFLSARRSYIAHTANCCICTAVWCLCQLLSYM